jgi:hypothetical protein
VRRRPTPGAEPQRLGRGFAGLQQPFRASRAGCGLGAAAHLFGPGSPVSRGGLCSLQTEAGGCGGCFCGLCGLWAGVGVFYESEVDGVGVGMGWSVTLLQHVALVCGDMHRSMLQT